MRFRLRTLLIVLALGPPVLAGLWQQIGPLLFSRDESFTEIVVLSDELVFSENVAFYVCTVPSRPAEKAVQEQAKSTEEDEK